MLQNLRYNMRKRGAQKTSFDTIVASGVRSALPHGVASNKVIEEGDFVTFDFGCIYDGYCSDMTRTVVMGKAAPWQKEIYEIVLAANELGKKSCSPGKTGIEVDQAVRDFIASKGMVPTSVMDWVMVWVLISTKSRTSIKAIRIRFLWVPL